MIHVFFFTLEQLYWTASNLRLTHKWRIKTNKDAGIFSLIILITEISVVKIEKYLHNIGKNVYILYFKSTISIKINWIEQFSKLSSCACQGSISTAMYSDPLKKKNNDKSIS